MHNQVSPAIVAITLIVTVGFTSFVLWRFAERHKPANAITARQMLSSPTVQNSIMDRYRAKYGGGADETSSM